MVSFADSPPLILLVSYVDSPSLILLWRISGFRRKPEESMISEGNQKTRKPENQKNLRRYPKPEEGLGGWGVIRDKKNANTKKKNT